MPRPRGGIVLPTLISPTATPNDQTLFDEPQTGGPQHYLPAYQLATTGKGSRMQFAVSLTATASGFLLTVPLVDGTSAAVISNRVRETPAAVYLLSTTLPGRTQTWDFPNAVVDGTSLTLTLPFSDPNEREAIYTAMTDPSQQTKLIVRRSPELALPVPLAAAVTGQAPPQQLYRQTALAIDTSINFTFDKTLDQNVFAGFTSAGNPAPSTLRRISLPYAVPGGQAQSAVPGQGVQTESYPYWQDPVQLDQFYFLPDSYKIARLATSPHTPAMNISTNGGDPATLTITLTFLAVPVWDPRRIVAAAGSLVSTSGFPKVSGLTILSATQTQLLLNLPPLDPTAESALVPVANAIIDTANGIQGSITLKLAQFQQLYRAIFTTPNVLLCGVVNIPVVDTAGDPDTLRVPFSGSALDFSGPIFDTSMTYDPAQNQVTVLVTNAIESPIHVAGQPVTLVDQGAALPAGMVNLSAALPVDLPPVQTTATAGTPGASSNLTITLQLAAGQSLDQSGGVQIDPSKAKAVPDNQAIWRAMIQNQGVGPVQKQITVQLPAEVFSSPATGAAGGASSSGAGASASSSSPGAAPAGASNSPLMAVQVVFNDKGQSLMFLPSTPAIAGLCSQTISLNVDIADYVLGRGDNSNYTYRVDTITANGTVNGPEISANLDDLFVTLGS